MWDRANYTFSWADPDAGVAASLMQIENFILIMDRTAAIENILIRITKLEKELQE